MPKTTNQPPIRLAIRKEGAFVNAYLAERDTMEGAQLMASIALGLVEQDNDHFDRWKRLLSDMFAVAIEDVLGQPPVSMNEEAAPEHERGGSA